MFESSVAVFGESRNGLGVFMRRGTRRRGTWVFGLADLVLATVVELEVFGSWVFGDGRRTRVGEGLGASRSFEVPCCPCVLVRYLAIPGCRGTIVVVV